MSSIHVKREKLYLRVYLKKDEEENPEKRRQWIPLELPDTREGWKKAREQKKAYDAGIIDKRMQKRIGAKLVPVLSAGVEEFNKMHSVEKTRAFYTMTGNKMIEYAGDKKVNYYTKKDFVALFNEIGKKLKPASVAAHSRGLHAIFNYFIKEKYITENPVNRQPIPKTEIEIIPEDELRIIMRYFGEKNINHFRLVNFLLLTGMRISSAIAQRWDWVNFDAGVMQVYNVKAKRFYFFPLYDELERYLKNLRAIDPEGVTIFKYKDRDSCKFWYKGLKYLADNKKIMRRYKMHSLRRTFATRLAKNKIDREIVKTLLDHSSVAITNQSYTSIDVTWYRDVFGKKEPVAKEVERGHSVDTKDKNWVQFSTN